MNSAHSASVLLEGVNHSKSAIKSLNKSSDPYDAYMSGIRKKNAHRHNRSALHDIAPPSDLDKDFKRKQSLDKLNALQILKS